jgi:hypothetical protein
MPVRRPMGKSLGKSNVPVIRSKRLHLQAFCDAGGGTRTPDTRIMIGAPEATIGSVEPNSPLLTWVRSGHI